MLVLFGVAAVAAVAAVVVAVYVADAVAVAVAVDADVAVAVAVGADRFVAAAATDVDSVVVAVAVLAGYKYNLRALAGTRLIPGTTRQGQCNTSKNQNREGNCSCHRRGSHETV